MTSSECLNAGATVCPYLFFSGRCAEALDFYTQAIGAQVEMVMRFEDSPEPTPPEMLPPGYEKKVMHAEFRIGETRLFASDGCDIGTPISGFSLALSPATVEETHRAFEALAEGGTVTLPLCKTFWSECYGMLTDRFGLNWMLMVAAPPEQ